jgi:class 3 adenylate cyclase
MVAGLLIPIHRKLRPQIERLFFRERYALEQGVDSLLGELTTCDTPERLLGLSGERLDELLRPESCVIYARAGDTYTPVFVQGRAVPAAFDAQSPLIAALRSRNRPLLAERWAASRDATGLGPFDRAALETLDVAVVLPIRRGTELLGFLCLGGKHSGDVYTSTDVALLGSVVHAISRELLRFDDAEVIRQSRAMQEALRRYVPAPVAARVAGGEPIHAGEREVSVLFVDIRGYITYAEGRRAEGIFRTTNRFTETVARIVREHGGTVVEFTGDGLMAVFGAPEPLAQKERAAVEAGRELHGAVDALVLDDAGPLSVGVGIATGPAWIGDVHAFDHDIWTVVGNTPNLAARLQALTRDLDAAMVIDAATWRRAGYVAADLVRREQLPIRGRTEPEDVYLLPLVPPRAAAAG